MNLNTQPERWTNLVEMLIDMRAITSSHRADTNGLSKYAAEGYFSMWNAWIEDAKSLNF